MRRDERRKTDSKDEKIVKELKDRCARLMDGAKNGSVGVLGQILLGFDERKNE